MARASPITSMAVVREKEIGTMEQLIVTPIRPWQLLVGKLAPFAIIGFTVAANALNLLVPKIIARAIDTFARLGKELEVI